MDTKEAAMPLENSPKLDDFDKVFVKPPRQVSPRMKQMRVLILFLGIVVVALGLVNLSQSDLTASLRGTGALKGVILDELGRPFNGSIYVEKTSLKTTTSPDGSFFLNNIPAGPQLIVIAQAGAGHELSVNIVAGQTADMGTLLFQSTETP
jgi:hypothetical protein